VSTHFVKTDAKVSRAGLRLVACVIFAGCVAVVLMIPTPVAPRELPTLVISHDVDSALLQRTRSLAARAPNDDTSRALERLVSLAGERELRLGATSEGLDREELDVVASRNAVVARHGRTSIAAVRARAVLSFVSAFVPGRAPGALRGTDRGLLGTFGVSLERWGVVRSGRLVAPRLVLRVLYAARWNVIARLAPTSGFGRAELRAYYGWLTLHAPDVPRDLRRAALIEFAGASDDVDASEAIAVLAYTEDDLPGAAASYRRLVQEHGDLRIRNAALAVHLLAR